MALKSPVPVHFLYFRTFCHATEDEERIEAALRLYVHDAPISRTTVHGHFGNPIVILEAKITDKKRIAEIFLNTITLNPEELSISMIGTRIDEQCFLYFRFDKQEAYLASHTQITPNERDEAQPPEPEMFESSHEGPHETERIQKAYWLIEHDDCIVMKAKIKAYPAKVSVAITTLQDYLQPSEQQNKV